MNKILLYPYCRAYESAIKFNNINRFGEIKNLVTPKGWGIVESNLKSDNSTEIRITNDFSDALEDSSIVWFVDDEEISLPYRLLKQKIKEAIEKDKRIIFSRYSDIEKYREVKAMIPKELLIIDPKLNIGKSSLEENVNCYEIRTPIVAVIGVDEGLDKFDTQLLIGQELRKKGYKVSSISSKLDGYVYGENSFPGFMFQKELSEIEKIIAFNNLVKKIEKEEEPDIMVIGIPGGVLPFDKRNHNNYGVLAFEVSKAISSDFTIVCVPYSDEIEKGYECVVTEIQNIFNFPVNALQVAPKCIDLELLNESSDKEYIRLDREFVANKLPPIKNILMGDLFHDLYREKVINSIVRTLSSDSIIEI